MYIGIVGLLLAVIGLAALLYPIYLDQYDIYGIEVSCGNALRSDLSQAARADHHDLVTHCDTALRHRTAGASRLGDSRGCHRMVARHRVPDGLGAHPPIKAQSKQEAASARAQFNQSKLDSFDCLV